MRTAKITFSNNETLLVKEHDLFIPIGPHENKDGIFSSQRKPIKIWDHISDGLIPSLTELFFNGPFFCSINNSNVIYGTSSIVKVENLQNTCSPHQ